MREQDYFLRNAMEAHGDTVYRLALCRMQNTADAEDVYQDVFLKLLGQKAQKWDGEHLKAWLIRATLNRCADLHRFRLRRPVLALEDIPDLARPLDEGGAELWDAVARLPEKLRTAVHLYYAEGYSTEEIAAMTDCPPVTVRTRLRRARMKLKDLLGGLDDEREQLPEADGGYPHPSRAQWPGAAGGQAGGTAGETDRPQAPGQTERASRSPGGGVRSLRPGPGAGHGPSAAR